MVWRDHAWNAVVDATSERFVRRSRTGPWTRWESDLVRHARRKGQTTWMEITSDRAVWRQLADSFVAVVK